MGDGAVNRWCILATIKTHPRMSRAVPSGRREGMFPDRYSEIFGLGERLGCVLNLDHSLDAIAADFEFPSMLITLAPIFCIIAAG